MSRDTHPSTIPSGPEERRQYRVTTRTTKPGTGTAIVHARITGARDL